MSEGIGANGRNQTETAKAADFSFASRRSPVRSRYAPLRNPLETAGFLLPRVCKSRRMLGIGSDYGIWKPLAHNWRAARFGTPVVDLPRRVDRGAAPQRGRLPLQIPATASEAPTLIPPHKPKRIAIDGEPGGRPVRTARRPPAEVAFGWSRRLGALLLPPRRLGSGDALARS